MPPPLTRRHRLHAAAPLAPPPLAVIAKRLISEALDAGTDDNVTVTVVFLRDLSFMT
jgi:serine/threonine protein phosphatase PrpC